MPSRLPWEKTNCFLRVAKNEKMCNFASKSKHEMMRYSDSVNAGFILSLQKDDGKINVKKIAINYPKEIISILEKLDYYEENLEWYDVFDVERFVQRSDFDKTREFKYCWPFEYNNSFKSKATVEKIDKKEYFQKLDEIEKRISLEYELKMKPKHKVGKQYIYLDESRKIELEKEKKEKIKEEQEKQKQRVLSDYIVMVRRYIFAQHYYNTLQTIKENSLMYSSDVMGWYEPNFNVAGNVRIGLKSNFCYGRSAYFDVLLNYKGINILPYSDLVNYYWSNMMDNLRCTRSYTTCRYNWPEVLKFVADICNWIEQDPVSFEKKWIIDEVEQMMDGLKDIHGKIEEYYKRLEEAKKEEDQKQKNNEIAQRIIRYRNINAFEISQHKTYPHELLLTIQVDKLTAALSLLDDLLSLKNIHTPVVDYINTIVQYNMEIVPAIKTQCKELDFNILNQEKELKRVEKNIKLEEKKLEIRKSEIDAAFELLYKKKDNSIPQALAIINNRNNDEEYKKINEYLTQLKEVKGQLELDIRTRQGFKAYLEGKKEYITECLKQRGNVK